MIQHILFATDGSFAAERALNYVASIAYRFHTKVTVLHAFMNVPMPLANYSFPNVEAFAQQKDAEDLVAKTAEHLHNLGVQEVETEVISGQPSSVILGVAETLKPDLIVLGARGLSTWQGILLGSVSTSVVQRAEVPVLIIK
jgi:nucleotide-binding universal stress UspA family protein